MSQPSNDEDSAPNIIDGPQRPLARKKSSKSRFGLVQKYHQEETTVPSSSCSEILNALSREEREFVQGLFPPSTRNTRTDRRPCERPARSPRAPGRRLILRRTILQNVNVGPQIHEWPVGWIVRNIWVPMQNIHSVHVKTIVYTTVRGILWKIFSILAVILFAVCIGQRKPKESQEQNIELS